MNLHFSQYKDTPKYVTDLSRKLRQAPTPQEEKLWSLISGKKLKGLKFRRQFPIGRYIVDFYNHTNKLVIEVDGEIHNKTIEYDHTRSNYLNACNCTVLRFTNLEIETKIEQVIQKIADAVKVPLRGI
jgi:very-short-patch-repair endonuclease